MADPFKLQQRLKRQLLKERPSVRDGMAIVQRALEEEDAAWKVCRGVDWESGLTRWVKWMDALVKEAPPPKLGMVWFETPSELNDAMTSVSGWTKAGPTMDSFGSNERRVWPLKKDGFTHDAGLLMQPELEDALTRVGWRGDDEGVADKLGSGVFAIGSSYTILLTLNGLPRTRFAQRWFKEAGAGGTLGVLFGWAEGDIEAVGGLAEKGWGAFPKVAVEKSSGPPGEMEIMSSPKKYLARGGDPRWRDKRTGKTILLRMAGYFPDLVDVKMAVEAGADPKAADKKGRTALHELGACGVPTLTYLIGKGADARAVDDRDVSVMDEVMSDGRCTVGQLETVYAAGGRPKARAPFAILAKCSVTSRESAAHLAMAGFWLRHGAKIDALIDGGVAPLWAALELEFRPFARARSGGYVIHTSDAGMLGTVKLLLKMGADPNVRHKDGAAPLIPAGATPLMVRCYYTDAFARELLKHGADPKLKCAKGRTAIEYAREAAKRPEVVGNAAAARVVRLLERAGG